MPTKISEKKLFVSIILFAGALFLFFTAKLTNAPVQVSELGLLAMVAAIVLFIFGVRLLSRAIQKV
jgi:hypothetical protein